MSITLNWIKKNSDALLNSYEVYRSTVKANVYQAGSLLASITNKAQLQYVDASPLAEVPYWYGIRTKTIYGDLDSKPLLQVDVSNGGFGPIDCLVGDLEDGYIASFVNEQLFAAAARKIILTQLIKFYPEAYLSTTFAPAIANVDSYCLHKYWKDGKLILTPNHPKELIQYTRATDLRTNIILPLIALAPTVEIDGTVYAFKIFTREEALKYHAGGNYQGPGSLLNFRSVPKTYNSTTGHGQGQYMTAIQGNDAGGVSTGYGAFFVNVNGNTPSLFPDANPAYVAPSWYFTPVTVNEGT